MLTQSQGLLSVWKLFADLAAYQELYGCAVGARTRLTLCAPLVFSQQQIAAAARAVSRGLEVIAQVNMTTESVSLISMISLPRGFSLFK